jgi:hypothetical protein
MEWIAILLADSHLACIIREDTTEGVSGDMRSPKSLLSA